MDNKDISFIIENLRDHAAFTYYTLYPTEKSALQLSNQLLVKFQSLNEEWLNINNHAYATFINKLEHEVRSLRAFHLQVLQKQLLGNINILLTPSTFNHFISEEEEALRILKDSNHEPPHYLYHSLIWLKVLEGDAALVLGALDKTEEDLIIQLRIIKDKMASLQAKVSEYIGFFRTGLNDFPALGRLKNEIKNETEKFIIIMKKMYKLEVLSQLLGKVSSIYFQHAIREANYLLNKITNN